MICKVTPTAQDAFWPIPSLISYANLGDDEDGTATYLM